MRTLKCEYCGKIVKELNQTNEKYFHEFQIAPKEWREQLMQEHYALCPKVEDPSLIREIGSGILK